jgi:hypothetical protein
MFRRGPLCDTKRPAGCMQVAFGPLQHELILYRYTGLQFACAPVHGRGSNCSTHHSTGDGRSSSQGGEPSVTAEAEQSAEANVFQGTTQRQHHPEADTELSVLQTTPDDADEGSESAPGPSNGQSTESAEEMPKKAAKFEGHFQLLWRKQLVQHPHMLCKDAFLVRPPTVRVEVLTLVSTVPVSKPSRYCFKKCKNAAHEHGWTSQRANI